MVVLAKKNGYLVHLYVVHLFKGWTNSGRAIAYFNGASDRSFVVGYASPKWMPKLLFSGLLPENFLQNEQRIIAEAKFFYTCD
jgi:hypothetical protein